MIQSPGLPQRLVQCHTIRILFLEMCSINGVTPFTFETAYVDAYSYQLLIESFLIHKLYAAAA